MRHFSLSPRRLLAGLLLGGLLLGTAACDLDLPNPNAATDAQTLLRAKAFSL
ncbi:hypothetical protein [Hymenobacter wooponensis]|uniref:hypothetical protein n=1 Tax=Hymenobacter wooponensis TaxID=1525360 RepID=UPI001AEBBD23|nr:hypothetical protein [Hymenobacter wooponensis]